MRWHPAVHRPLLALALGGLLLLGGCIKSGTGAPGSGTGNPGAEPPPAPGDQPPAAGLRWQARTEADVPEAVRQWLERNVGQLGIYQETFGDETYVLFAWGTRRTGGYAVRVRDVSARDGVLRTVVELDEPDPGQPVTQAITKPYALIAVQPARHYELEPVFQGATFYKNEAFEILEPAPFTLLEDRVRLRGRARVFEATFMVALDDGHLEVIKARPVMADQGAPEWGDFDVELRFEQRPHGPRGTLHVYEASAKDGQPVHQIMIPVRFAHYGE